MRLHYEVCGEGPALVILHGLFGSLENWRSMARRLGAHFRVFAIDQRNHGKSPHVADMNYELMAGDVLSIMREAGLARAHVLGHSMGGKTAMQLALMHPDAVERLVIADIAPKSYPPHHDKIIQTLLSIDFSMIKSRKDLDSALAQSIPDTAVRQFLVKDAKPIDGSFRWQMNIQAIADNYAQLLAFPSSTGPFEGPTLFVCGEQSDYITGQDLPLIRTLFPKCILETIPSAGHWLHAEAPEAFFRIVRDFLLAGKTAGAAIE
jgi:esterase